MAERVGSTCSTSSTSRIALVPTPVISQEEDQIVITTNGTYQWSFVTKIFSHGSRHETIEVMVVPTAPTDMVQITEE